MFEKTKNKRKRDLHWAIYLKNPFSGFSSEVEAAIVIQSAFKGYKVRREIQEIQTFYQQIYRSESGRPGDFRTEPLSRKNRQDSYMKAMSSMSQDDDDTDLSKKNKETWKLRQDSYLRAIGKSTDVDVLDPHQVSGKPKRQDSYLQAIRSSENDGSPSKRWGHQHSYQIAVGSNSPDSHSDEEENLPANGMVAQINGSYLPNDDLPDLQSADVADAALKIQAAYRGFMVRKIGKQEELPDLNDPQLGVAAVKIQSVYRGFRTRQKNQLFNFSEAADMARAAIKIQSA